MYEQFFGLRERPFSLTPDTEYFYRFSGHQEALNVLLVALRNGEGFVRVTGEVGTGKTLLCRQLLKILQHDCAIAYLPNPLLTPLELYQAISHDLCLDFPADASLQQLQQGIFAELVRLHEAQRPLVVLIDEAQAMPHKSLESLRLLSNLETEKEKLLHIFFFAQPEFEQRLAEGKLRQLRQRITFAYTLEPLQLQELSAYLQYRLQVAGFHGANPFTAAAMKLLHRSSNGVPRLINILSHKAFLLAYGKGERNIGHRIIKAAIKDTAGVNVSRRSFFPRYVLELGLVTMVAMVTLLIFGALK